MRGGLLGSDLGLSPGSTWFFSAPPNVVSKLRCASGITYRLSHPEYDSRQLNPILSEFDAVITTAGNSSLGRRIGIPPW